MFFGGEESIQRTPAVAVWESTCGLRYLSVLGPAANDATARTHRQQLKTACVVSNFLCACVFGVSSLVWFWSLSCFDDVTCVVGGCGFCQCVMCQPRAQHHHGVSWRRIMWRHRNDLRPSTALGSPRRTVHRRKASSHISRTRLAACPSRTILSLHPSHRPNRRLLCCVRTLAGKQVNQAQESHTPSARPTRRPRRSRH